MAPSSQRVCASRETRPAVRRSEENMSYESQRIMSAVMFALNRTAGMLWWFYPEPGVMHPALLAVGGVLIGVFWYWVQGRLWRNIE
jgi:hypothetical protein